MVRPRGLVRVAPPQLSFRPAGGIIGRRQGSLLDADQHHAIVELDLCVSALLMSKNGVVFT